MSLTNAELLARARQRVGSIVHGKYRIVRVLGMGGMGVVYEAVHRNRARFALKLLHPDLAVGEAVRARFHREAYAANIIADEGVVRVVDDDVTEDGAAYLVMELLEGTSVDDLALRHGDVLPLAVAVAIVRSALGTLEAAHAQRLVHRDIKPGNLFVTRNGRVKVLDFGIARALDGDGDGPWPGNHGGALLTGAGIPLGTPAFMAPEQVRTAEDSDARTDVWAAGATLFTLLAGRTVHVATTAAMALVQSATDRAPPLSSVAPDVPASVAAVVDRALAFDRDDRWPSALAMRDALDLAMGALGVPLASSEELARLGAPPRLGAPAVVDGNADPLGRTEADDSHPPRPRTEPMPRTTSAGLDVAPTARRRLKASPWVLLGAIVAVTVVWAERRHSAPLAAHTGSAAPSLVPSAAPMARPAHPVILIESFEVRTPEPLLDGMVERLFSAALSMSTTYDAHADLSSVAQYLAAGDRERLPAALLARGHSPIVLVRGNVKAEGIALRFSIEAKDAQTGRVIVQASRSAPDLAHSVAAVSTLALDLREALGDIVEARDTEAHGSVSESLEADHEWGLATDVSFGGEYAKAATSAERAVALDPTFARAHHELGFLYFDLGRYADAAREYGIAARSTNLPRRTQREYEADWKSMVGRYDEAVVLYEELAREEPEEWSYTVDLADTLVLARRPQRALEVQRGLANDTPLARLTGMNTPAYCLLSGNLEDAVATANDFIKQSPHLNDAVLVGLGAASALLGRPSEARAAYARTVHADRGTYALTDLALFLDDASALARVVPELALATAKAEGADAAHYSALLAEARLRLGDRKGALAAADRATASTEPWARYAGARVDGSLRETKRLDTLLSTSQDQAADAVHVAKLVQGLTLRVKGKAGESLAPLEEAKALVDSWPVHLELAESYLALGDREAAKKELEVCLARRGEGALVTMLYDVPTLRYVRTAEEWLARMSGDASAH